MFDLAFVSEFDRAIETMCTSMESSRNLAQRLKDLLAAIPTWALSSQRRSALDSLASRQDDDEMQALALQRTRRTGVLGFVRVSRLLAALNAEMRAKNRERELESKYLGLLATVPEGVLSDDQMIAFLPFYPDSDNSDLQGIVLHRPRLSLHVAQHIAAGDRGSLLREGLAKINECPEVLRWLFDMFRDEYGTMHDLQWNQHSPRDIVQELEADAGLQGALARGCALWAFSEAPSIAYECAGIAESRARENAKLARAALAK